MYTGRFVKTAVLGALTSHTPLLCATSGHFTCSTALHQEHGNYWHRAKGAQTEESWSTSSCHACSWSDLNRRTYESVTSILRSIAALHLVRVDVSPQLEVKLDAKVRHVCRPSCKMHHMRTHLCMLQLHTLDGHPFLCNVNDSIDASMLE